MRHNCCRKACRTMCLRITCRGSSWQAILKEADARALAFGARKIVGFTWARGRMAARRTSHHRRGVAPRRPITLVVVAVVMAKRITGACAGNRPTRRAPDEIPKFLLTDGQRDTISRLSGIPKNSADAWPMIEVLVGTYRSRKAHRQSDEARPAELRSELRALSTDLWKLFGRVQLLIKRQPPDFAFSFTDELRMLRELELRFFLAAKDIGSAKRGPSTRDVYILVSNLAGIREEFTGRKITRAAKRDTSREYVRTVCQIADPDIGSGTIDDAMKSTIKKFRGGIVRNSKR